MTHLLTHGQLKSMAAEGVLVLSPHFDDGCFSLGGMLTTWRAGVLVNVFNRSIHIPNTDAGSHVITSESQVAQVRDQEDQIFADRCAMGRCQLEGAEPGLLGRRPNDLSGLPHDIEAMTITVLEKLQQLRGSHGKRPWLMTPMAIGRHVNHHAVHQIIWQHREFLRSAFRLGFYEDLPYAHDPVARIHAIKRFRSQWGRGMIRQAWPITWAKKLELVMIYASQHKRTPSVMKYRPAAIWPMVCHEAFWCAPDELEIEFND
ncbi:PIG-L family deacetylase [Limnohabitans sp. T6-5]|uniref:PIG-L family deacetylase n=1 Tax=Limnohabitans sp. T6-5 TaxID=1100724 RepID=UPI000D342E68|nr:PIG-L family deacetylase [Limnohabitans sp. T6-5]